MFIFGAGNVPSIGFLCFLQHDGFHQPVHDSFSKASVGVMT